MGCFLLGLNATEDHHSRWALAYVGPASAPSTKHQFQAGAAAWGPQHGLISTPAWMQMSLPLRSWKTLRSSFSFLIYKIKILIMPMTSHRVFLWGLHKITCLKYLAGNSEHALCVLDKWLLFLLLNEYIFPSLQDRRWHLSHLFWTWKRIYWFYCYTVFSKYFCWSNNVQKNVLYYQEIPVFQFVRGSSLSMSFWAKPTSLIPELSPSQSRVQHPNIANRTPFLELIRVWTKGFHSRLL